MGEGGRVWVRVAGWEGVGVAEGEGQRVWLRVGWEAKAR